MRAEFPNIFARVLSGAPDISTLDPAHLAVGDVERDIVSHAVQAEAMRTLLDAVEILRVVVFVTDFTSFTSFFYRLDFSLYGVILSFNQLGIWLPTK